MDVSGFSGLWLPASFFFRFGKGEQHWNQCGSDGFDRMDELWKAGGALLSAES